MIQFLCYPTTWIYRSRKLQQSSSTGCRANASRCAVFTKPACYSNSLFSLASWKSESMFLVLGRVKSTTFKGNFITKTENGKVGTGRFPQRDFSAVINDPSFPFGLLDCSRSPFDIANKMAEGEGTMGGLLLYRRTQEDVGSNFTPRLKLGPLPLWLKIFSGGDGDFCAPRLFFFSSLFYRPISSNRKSQLALFLVPRNGFPIFAEEN